MWLQPIPFCAVEAKLMSIIYIYMCVCVCLSTRLGFRSPTTAGYVILMTEVEGETLCILIPTGQGAHLII